MPKRHAILPVKDVNQQMFVRKLGGYLKKSGKISAPDWVDCVKTGYHKELPPNNPNWLFVRMAAVIRRLYMRNPSGVGGLARRFGGRNCRRGVRPEHTARGSRKIVRYSLQQLEKLGWIKKAERGRKITRKGKAFLEDFSGRVVRSRMTTNYYHRKARLAKKAWLLAREKALGTSGTAATITGTTTTTTAGKTTKNAPAKSKKTDKSNKPTTKKTPQNPKKDQKDTKAKKDSKTTSDKKPAQNQKISQHQTENFD